MTETLTALSAKLWGAPLLALLLGTGIFLTVRMGFATWRNLPGACWQAPARGTATAASRPWRRS